MANNTLEYFKRFELLGGQEKSFFPSGKRPEWAIGCFDQNMIPPNGIFGGQLNDYSLLVLIMQIVIATLILRLCILILRPLRTPRVVAEILCGVILGPTVIGNSVYGTYDDGNGGKVDWSFWAYLFPSRSLTVLETTGNVGLLYYLFMIGVEVDVSIITRTGKKAMVIAATCIGVSVLIPVVVTYTIGNVVFTAEYLQTLESDQKAKHSLAQYVVLGVSTSVTAFPVVARILTENKLLNTEIGRVAMSTALIIDVVSWVHLAAAIPLTDGRANITENSGLVLAPIWNALGTLGMTLFGIYVLRPGISWFIRRNPENFTPVVSLLLVGVLGFASLSDLIGAHAMFGALLFGLITPRGPITIELVERLEDIVSGIFLPLFFVVSGLRTHIHRLVKGADDLYSLKLFFIVIGSFTIKAISVFVAGIFQKMSVTDSLALAFLMNTKGTFQLIILNIARDQMMLDRNSFSVMILVTILATGIASPVVTLIYKSSRGYITYKHRTIRNLNKGTVEFRVLACVHNNRQVPSIISLIEMSRPSEESPIGVYALHLVELTGRASAMLIVHNPSNSGVRATGGTQTQYEQIINAFQSFERHSSAAYVHTITTVSSFNSIHEDICNQAEEKRTSFIILPFHKHFTVDGGMETTHPAHQSINRNVLVNAPCSVGILIDRGINKPIPHDNFSHNIVVLFFGGPDDREALSYAQRMAERPDISLTVLRFCPRKQVKETWTDDDSHHQARMTVVIDIDREKQADDDFIRKFRMKTTGTESIVYLEKVVNNVEETVGAIRSIDTTHDMYIVGRGQGTIGELTAGLVDWSDCPELGGIGDLLASAEFKHASVLVVQQYSGAGALPDDTSTPSSQGNTSIHYH